MFVENFICSAIFIMTKIWDSKKKHSIFFLFLVKTKSYWKNCLEVQKYAYRRVMDMDGVSISCQNEQGWITKHLQYVLELRLCFITTVFADSIELWRFVQFCQILTFFEISKSRPDKNSKCIIKFFRTKLWALKDSNAKKFE